MSYVLGVDGGNTKTIALVASADGRIVGVGRSGCSDIYGAASPEAALGEADAAVAAALSAAGIQREALAAGCLAASEVISHIGARPIRDLGQMAREHSIAI